jgi:hypothetical protein
MDASFKPTTATDATDATDATGRRKPSEKISHLFPLKRHEQQIFSGLTMQRPRKAEPANPSCTTGPKQAPRRPQQYEKANPFAAFFLSTATLHPNPNYCKRSPVPETPHTLAA